MRQQHHRLRRDAPPDRLPFHSISDKTLFSYHLRGRTSVSPLLCAAPLASRVAQPHSARATLTLCGSTASMYFLSRGHLLPSSHRRDCDITYQAGDIKWHNAPLPSSPASFRAFRRCYFTCRFSRRACHASLLLPFARGAARLRRGMEDTAFTRTLRSHLCYTIPAHAPQHTRRTLLHRLALHLCRFYYCCSS